MGKNKQQRPKRKKVKTSLQDKDRMKEVLLQLANSKARNKAIVERSTSITQMHIKHKKIHKDQPKPNPEEEQDEKNEPEPVPVKPMINIFAVDSYQS